MELLQAPLCHHQSGMFFDFLDLTLILSISPQYSIPQYTCQQNLHHVCTCCSRRFPNRLNQPNLPQVQCLLCQKHFCHLYWGCDSSCGGCLAKLQDWKPTVNMDLINGALSCATNIHEAQLFAVFVNDNQILPPQIIETGLPLALPGTFLPFFWFYDLNFICFCVGFPNLTDDSAVCRLCFRDNLLKTAVFEAAKHYKPFRTDSPRPDCRWGKNCRTQKKNREHQNKFNHICD